MRNLYKRDRKEIENVYYHDLIEQKKYTQAIEELDEALAENPADLRKLWLKAKTQYHDGNLSDAKRLFRSIQTKEPRRKPRELLATSHGCLPRVVGGKGTGLSPQPLF